MKAATPGCHRRGKGSGSPGCLPVRSKRPLGSRLKCSSGTVTLANGRPSHTVYKVGPLESLRQEPLGPHGLGGFRRSGART